MAIIKLRARREDGVVLDNPVHVNTDMIESFAARGQGACIETVTGALLVSESAGQIVAMVQTARGEEVRDRFIAAALANFYRGGISNDAYVAERCIEIADAIMAARARSATKAPQ